MATSASIATRPASAVTAAPWSSVPTPRYTAAEFAFLSGITLNSVTVDVASSPLFEPGSVLSWSGDHIRLVLSNTCELCDGISKGGPGESIFLNVNPVPKPSTYALLATDRQLAL